MDITIEQPARARLVTAESQELPVAATLRYASADPLAVYLDFPPDVSLDGEGVTWTFARGLLEEGLTGPAGSGDVHLWPCGGALTVVELHSPCGLALLQFDTAALRRFLLRTYAVVGAGREDVGAAVERGLTSLFGGV
ncbi:SsgA family sporulation/cell division regulator [Streptomyces resistomycificus]|uniref:SsgD protein n=1 Tax=Streptomyces resistomycificus TaxID=67356 RepID=A0A0L8LZW1_9ACTN|nr:SsgA family sporulation/cell division regulator [Streptomyces resistomycificus]KOG43717.1 SsgD protein [Streptomyces resistomycificus]KUN99875.1 SsgD protein [Streptomyces resistomycificus]